ncbi:TetR/AcrR family transcriptional regulator [Dactylosporangium sp. NPDC048998]|uniref:TetR/AcrR family transcriptional regulator n=1 Tax=Dactylosporangium sp. NPDC048998 TaxID=3363976 RepID=UPI0037244682
MRSTAEARRAVLLDRAVSVFARNGYHATPVTAVAAAAGISEAYALRLFSGKLGLFVAAVEACYERILATLEAAAERAEGQGPQQLLESLGDAYAELIGDRDLLLLQVHAQSVSDVPEVGAAVRAGYKRLVHFLRAAGAEDRQIQHFVAYGQLCHLIVTAGLDNTDNMDESWARALTDGMRHVS